MKIMSTPQKYKAEYYLKGIKKLNGLLVWLLFQDIWRERGEVYLLSV